MSSKPSAEKIKKSQTLQKVVSEFIQSESPFEPHLKVSEPTTPVWRFFVDTLRDLYLLSLITGNLMKYVIH